MRARRFNGRFVPLTTDVSCKITIIKKYLAEKQQRFARVKPTSAINNIETPPLHPITPFPIIFNSRIGFVLQKHSHNFAPLSLSLPRFPSFLLVPSGAIKNPSANCFTDPFHFRTGLGTCVCTDRASLSRK